MHDFANEKLPVSLKDVCKMNCNIRGIYETRHYVANMGFVSLYRREL